jgi:hypothetical protein
MLRNGIAQMVQGGAGIANDPVATGSHEQDMGEIKSTTQNKMDVRESGDNPAFSLGKSC